MKLRILVTSAGGGLAPEFLRLFKNIKGYNIITFGVDKTLKATSKNFADFFYKVSGGKSKKFITEINKISKNNKINLIIPGSDEDALNLSKILSKIFLCGEISVLTKPLPTLVSMYACTYHLKSGFQNAILCLFL